jgi:hypothetical protein
MFIFVASINAIMKNIQEPVRVYLYHSIYTSLLHSSYFSFNLNRLYDNSGNVQTDLLVNHTSLHMLITKLK